MKRAAQLGGYVYARLSTLPYAFQGRGLVWAVQLPSIAAADAVVDEAAEGGVLLLRTKRGTVKLGPPLTIPDQQIAMGMDILSRALLAQYHREARSA